MAQHRRLADASRRPVILAVDDEEGVRFALGLTLEPDFEVLTAGDGPSALSLLNSHLIDAVLLDLRLRGMQGLEVLERMKAIDPRVQVIVLSAVVEVPVVVQAMHLGAIDYLEKPWDAAILHEKIRRAVQRRRQETEAVVLLGEDAAALAAVQIALERQLIAATSLSVGRALDELTGRSLALIIFDNTESPEAAAPVVRSLSQHFPSSPLLVMTADAGRARFLPDLAAVLPWGLIAKPCRLETLLGRIGSILASRDIPRPSWTQFVPAVTSAMEHVAHSSRLAVSVDDVARGAGVPASRLGRLFHDALGMGVKAFQLRVRIAVACRLLAETTLKLEQVAERSGFSDAAHFSHAFVGQMNMRPGEYRLRHGWWRRHDAAPLPPSDTAATRDELRARIVLKLRAGDLPKHSPRPERLGPVTRRRVGVSEGTRCSGCDAAIKQGETMVDHTYSTGRVICFHESCEQIWDEERTRA